MKQVRGSEAYQILAEVHLGHLKLSDAELSYLKRQCRNFTKWLVNQGRTPSEAIEICKNIYKSANRILQKSDFLEEFKWSRQGDVSAAEVSGFGESFDKDPEARLNAEFAAYTDGWKQPWIVAEKNATGIHPEHWAKIRERIEVVQSILDVYEARETLSNKDLIGLKHLKEYVRQLRFGKQVAFKRLKNGGTYRKYKSVHGDGIHITTKYWKLLTNRIHALLGIEKRYEVKENYEKIDPTDALDAAVHGWDFSRYSLVK